MVMQDFINRLKKAERSLIRSAFCVLLHNIFDIFFDQLGKLCGFFCGVALEQAVKLDFRFGAGGADDEVVVVLQFQINHVGGRKQNLFGTAGCNLSADRCLVITNSQNLFAGKLYMQDFMFGDETNTGNVMRIIR